MNFETDKSKGTFKGVIFSFTFFICFKFSFVYIPDFFIYIFFLGSLNINILGTSRALVNFLYVFQEVFWRSWYTKCFTSGRHHPISNLEATIRRPALVQSLLQPRYQSLIGTTFKNCYIFVFATPINLNVCNLQIKTCAMVMPHQRIVVMKTVCPDG